MPTQSQTEFMQKAVPPTRVVFGAVIFILALVSLVLISFGYMSHASAMDIKATTLAMVLVELLGAVLILARNGVSKLVASILAIPRFWAATFSLLFLVCIAFSVVLLTWIPTLVHGLFR